MTGRCPKCGSDRKRRRETVTYRGVALGPFNRYDCPRCGLSVYSHALWQAMVRVETREKRTAPERARRTRLPRVT